MNPNLLATLITGLILLLVGVIIAIPQLLYIIVVVIVVGTLWGIVRTLLDV